jgi:hypothetical protein
LAHVVAGRGSEGARFSVSSPGVHRGAFGLPLDVEVPAGSDLAVVATKAGEDRLEIPLVFPDGEAERTFTVSFYGPDEDPPGPSRCNCAPGDLACAMKCAAGHAGEKAEMLDGATISRVVARSMPAVRRDCWDPALARRDANAPSTARVGVSLTIAPNGTVQNLTTSSDPRGYPGLAQCIEKRVLGWRFPKSSGSVTANVPFVFAGN